MDYGLAASRASPLWPLAGVSAALASQLGPLPSAVTLTGALAALAAPLGLSPRSVVLAGASTAIALKYNHMQRGILQLVG